jgi:hypothetical protein
MLMKIRIANVEHCCCDSCQVHAVIDIKGVS